MYNLRAAVFRLLIRYGIAAVLSVVTASCVFTASPPSHPISMPYETIQFSIAKWQNNHRAAVSLTYDHGWTGENPAEQDVERLLKDSGVVMDFDVTTSYMGARQYAYLRDSLRPRPYISFFGHGHWHVNTDALSEDSARKNFRQCYDSMLSVGLRPISYAYPGGYGYDVKTRRACRDAGFLSARMFAWSGSPCIMPDSMRAPEDWFALPTLPMFGYDWQRSDPLLNNATGIVHTTEELVPFLDEAVQSRAWIILTYHAITTAPTTTYRFEDFKRDISAVKTRNFWIASMNTLTLYATERAKAHMETQYEHDELGALQAAVLRVEDNLPDDLYSVPLTVCLVVPTSWRNRALVLLEGNDLTQRDTVVCHADSCMITVLPNNHRYTLRPAR